MKKIQKIIGKIVNVLIVFVIIAIILCAYSVFSIKVLHKSYVNFFGYSVFEVATGSMRKEINVGDAVLVKIDSDYNVGDIVTYQSGDDFITHRVISKNDGYVITKGDANNVNDNPIDEKLILGRVVKIMPNVGVWKKVILTPKVIGLILITLFVFSILFSYEGSAIKIVASKRAQKEIDSRIEDEVNREINKKVAAINRKKKRVKKVLDATQIIDLNAVKEIVNNDDKKPISSELTKTLAKDENNKVENKKPALDDVTIILDTDEVNNLKKESLEKTQVLDLNEVEDIVKNKKQESLEKTQVLDLNEVEEIKNNKRILEATQVLDLDEVIKDIKKTNNDSSTIEATQILDLNEVDEIKNKKEETDAIEATQIIDVSSMERK